MPIDQSRIRKILERSKVGAEIAQVVQGAGFQISFALEAERDDLWGLYLKPNKTLRDLFGTSREVLLWVAEYPEFQARTIERAQEILDREQPRLSDEFCLILTPDLGARDKVVEASAQMPAEYIGMSFGSLPRFRPYGSESFISFLQAQLFTRDLYRVSTALTHPRGFFGRQALIAETVNTLRNGASNVGIFGLRKMGKTSLLYRILDNLRSRGGVLAAHVDVQRLDALNPSVGYALWSIGEALVDSNPKLRRLNGLKLFGKASLYSDTDTRSIPELFDHDIRLVLNSSKRQVVVLLDEIELMSPDTPGSQWGSAFVQLWRLLRGLHQQLPGRLAYLVTGTNPSCIEKNKLLGVENPAYNYFDTKYLPALTQDESSQLLRQIGIRMGLLWRDAAVERCFGLVAGHPFLLRSLASVVHRALLPRSEQVTVAAADVQDATESFFSEFNPNLSQMVEVLADYYPDEFFLLETLARGRIGEFRDLAAQFPEDVAHLRGYGLISEVAGEPVIPLEVLHTWFQRRARREERVRSDAPEGALSPGDRVGRYSIDSSIGHRGGFAEVYRAAATSSDGTLAAIKVFKSGSFASLQREMDVLEQTRHPNIVRFLDYGRSDEGHLFLAMEYLDGESLRSRCERANRLTPREILSCLLKLSDALVALHPNSSVVDRIRDKEEISAAELAALEEARHGYVHRDIKPENIVVVDGRGPVLIDFNISCEVGRPVTTLQRTPGYIPPDGPSPRWSPDVDLYALGLTMLQAAVGLEYEQDNLPDLKALARRELDGEIADTLLKLCAPSGAERFESAAEVFSVARRISRRIGVVDSWEVV